MPNVYVSNPVSPKKPPLATETARSKAWWQQVVTEILERVDEKPRSTHLGAFCVRPPVHFLTQQDDEEIVLLLRAHPITNVGWILLTLVMLLAPSIVLGSGVLDAVPGKFIFMGRLTWYLVTLMYAFEKFLYWYYSVFIVTNERVVDIDFDNLTYRNITYANLNHIEEPEMVTSGFVRSFFQYGNVFVTTASEKPTLEALGVPWPQKVVDIVCQLAEELEKRRERGE